MNSVELGERIIELKKKGITVIFTSQLSSEACGNLPGFIKACNSQEWVGRQHVFLLLLSGKVSQNRSKYVSVKEQGADSQSLVLRPPSHLTISQARRALPSQTVMGPALFSESHRPFF